MTLPHTAAQVLSGNVRLEIRCIDRMLLTFRQPRLQYGQGIHGFFCHHRGNQFVSSALMRPMTERFGADIRHYIDSRGLNLVRFAKGQSKDQIARASLLMGYSLSLNGGRQRAAPAGCLCRERRMPGHAQADGSTAGGELAHGFQFLRGGGQGGLDRGDLAEPALVPGLLEPVGEVRADLLQARHLGRVNHGGGDI